MKRSISVFLIVIFLLSSSGCSAQKNEAVRVPVSFYYCNQSISYNTSDGVISAEVRESDGHTDDWEYLVNLYLQGPVSDQFQSPFPPSVELKELVLDNDTIRIVLTKDLSALKGLDLTLACACLTMTLKDLTNANTVIISVIEGKLGNSSSITMDTDTLLLFDNGADIIVSTTG